jgi:L-seryl-tRNA(Ser) seleniumtransferase
MRSTKPEPASRLLRSLPAVDALSRHESLGGWPVRLVVRETRRVLDEVRAALVGSGDAEIDPGSCGPDALSARILERVRSASTAHHRRVINATGIVLHTGIGRAPLAAAARAAIADAAGYAVVEVDPSSGQRNQREEAVASLLKELLGVEAALVVNNNAAAVHLTLSALAAGREVVVSRGELVEIGGGFRMPDVMAEACCRMVEVGATNRTHLRDFERAIGPATELLLKVHPSNYRVVGFHSMPELTELCALGRERSVAVFEDLGSGLLADPVPSSLAQESRVQESVASGAELVCFSGDKLLGGPQCGILVGEAARIAAVRAHPLYRAFRSDKLTLAALEATLRIYRDGDPLREIPTLAMLAREADELRAEAEDLASLLGDLSAAVRPSESFVGSGANPARPIPSYAVVLPGGDRTAKRLRQNTPVPIFSRVAQDLTWLDLRTLQLENREQLAAWIRAAL